MSKYDYISYFESAMQRCIDQKDMLYTFIKNIEILDVEEVFNNMHAFRKSSYIKKREMMIHLRNDFIPIFEREDVLQLANLMEDVIFHLENISKTFMIFHIKEIDNYIQEFMQILDKAVIALSKVIGELSNFRVKENISDLSDLVKEIESEADTLYLKGLIDLYSCEPESILYALSRKAIIQSFEEAVDACEDVAYFIEVIQINNV